MVKSNTVLKISFSAPVPERSSNNPFENFDPLSFNMDDPALGLQDVLKNIKRAKTDSKIVGIYLNLMNFSGNFGGMATMDDIRDVLLDFKESGKFIYAYQEIGMSQKGYYLATVADSIFLNPEASLMHIGLGSEISFYKNTLKKLGIEPVILRGPDNKYKSAVEPFLKDKMSDANREQTEAYLNSIWNKILTGISKERNISIEELNRLADNATVRDAKSAKEHNFIDETWYKDEFIDFMKAKLDIKDSKKIRLVTLADYNNAPSKTKAQHSKNKIAVIYATGTIGMGSTSTQEVGPDLAEDIRKARKDTTVKAIVLRVNSPGGSSLTSDIILREIKLAKEAKPVIASYGDVAASGGYYISCAADKIVAQENTITGSIGVYGMFFAGEELIKEKIGLTLDVIKTNELSDFGGGMPLGLPLASRGLTSVEEGIIQESITHVYDTFINHVAEGRNMTAEEVDNMAQGRVWIGSQAKEIGLVDEIGDLNYAIELAKEAAGIESYKVQYLPKQEDPIQKLMEDLTGQAKTMVLESVFGMNYDYVNKVQSLLNNQGIQARLPYDIVIR